MTRIQHERPVAPAPQQPVPLAVGAPAVQALPLTVPTDAPAGFIAMIAPPPPEPQQPAPVPLTTESVTLLLQALEPLQPAAPPSVMPAPAFSLPETPVLVIPTIKSEVIKEGLADATAQEVRLAQVIFGTTMQRIAEPRIESMSAVQLGKLAEAVAAVKGGKPAQVQGALQGLFSVADCDVETLVSLVLFKVSSDSRQDVKDLLADVQANNDKKAQIRDFEQQLKVQRDQVQQLQRDTYDARRALPQSDPRYIPESVTFEQYAADQPVVCEPSLSEDTLTDNPVFRLSRNETYYPSEIDPAVRGLMIQGASFTQATAVVTGMRMDVNRHGPAAQALQAQLVGLASIGAQQAVPPHHAEPNEMTPAGLDTFIEGWSGKRESLSDIGQSLQLKLQLRMEAYTSAQSLLSNVIKKISATSDGIISNFK